MHFASKTMSLFFTSWFMHNHRVLNLLPTLITKKTPKTMFYALLSFRSHGLCFAGIRACWLAAHIEFRAHMSAWTAASLITYNSRNIMFGQEMILIQLHQRWSNAVTSISLSWLVYADYVAFSLYTTVQRLYVQAKCSRRMNRSCDKGEGTGL